MIIDLHPNSPLIRRSSSPLGDFNYNPAVGCLIGCNHCSIPQGIAKHNASLLTAHGVRDAEINHGKYLFIRRFEEKAFRKSLAIADEYSVEEDGETRSGVLVISSTTDPYQKIPDLRSPDARELQHVFDDTVEQALIQVLHESSLRVRVITRCPRVKRHFELFSEFGDRLLFGMSVPTLNEALSSIYEPGAAPPRERMQTMRAARKAGLNCFVCMSPTYPECDEEDLRRTLSALAELNPVTVFHESINIRGDNLQRLSHSSRKLMENWAEYATRQIQDVHRIAGELGVSDRLHFLPDERLKELAPYWFNYWRGLRPKWPHDMCAASN